MDNTVATQVRLPAELHEWIKQEAKRLGVAQNALLLILLDKGRKVWAWDIAATKADQ